MKEFKKREIDEAVVTECAHSKAARCPRRRLCYCPVEGCTSKPIAELSNHLAQVHHFNPQQRAKYLGCSRVFILKKDRVKKTVLEGHRELYHHS